MGNDRVAKRVFVEVLMGTRLVGWEGKRWVDAVNAYLKKRSLDVGQARRMK